MDGWMAGWSDKHIDELKDRMLFILIVLLLHPVLYCWINKSLVHLSFCPSACPSIRPSWIDTM